MRRKEEVVFYTTQKIKNRLKSTAKERGQSVSEIARVGTLQHLKDIESD